MSSEKTELPRWLLVPAGILSVVVAIILVVAPVSGAFTLVWVLGVYAVAAGLVSIFLGLSSGNEKVEIGVQTSSYLFSGARATNKIQEYIYAPLAFPQDNFPHPVYFLEKISAGFSGKISKKDGVDVPVLPPVSYGDFRASAMTSSIVVM
jgi:hypothetical protein